MDQSYLHKVAMPIHIMYGIYLFLCVCAIQYIQNNINVTWAPGMRKLGLYYVHKI